MCATKDTEVLMGLTKVGPLKSQTRVAPQLRR